MPVQQVVDERRLHEASGGSDEFEIDLLELLVNDGRVRIRSLIEAIAAGDAVAARHEAHTLKGSSGSVGADTLSSVARDAEERCTKGELSAIPVESLQEELDRVADYLRNRRG